MGGISLQTSKVLNEGIQWDRNWMLVNAEGKFQTQREHRGMVGFKTALKPDGIQVSFENEQVFLPFVSKTIGQRKVSIWEHELDALVCEETLSDWFSQRLNSKLQLICLDKNNPRIKKIRVKPDEVPIRFSDGYPYTILGTASLDLLNSKLDEPLPSDRFRSTIVVNTKDPHQEDSWTDFTINGLGFRMVKPCSRCVVTTINQNDGSSSKEPLRTLNTYRKEGKYVNFTMNAICLQEGTISVGDALEV